MPEGNSHQQRVKQLVAQDPEINPLRMEEFRMQLENNLDLSEARAKQMRRKIVTAFVVYLAAMFGWFIYLSQWGNATRNPASHLWRMWISVPLVISMWTALVILLLLVLQFLFKTLPRLGRARFELQTSILLELQQQMKQLRENMERRDK